MGWVDLSTALDYVSVHVSMVLRSEDAHCITAPNSVKDVVFSNPRTELVHIVIKLWALA